MSAANRSKRATRVASFYGLAIVCSVFAVSSSLGWEVSAAEVEGEPDEALKQEILDAMQRRAEFAKSFVIEWKESASPIDDEVTKQLLAAIEAEETSSGKVSHIERARVWVALHLGGNYRLVVDGEKMRFDRLGYEPAIDDPTKLIAQTIVAAFDGKVCRTATLQSAGSYPRGSVAPTNDTHGFDYIGSKPIVVALDGPDWLAPFNIVASRGTLEGKPMAVLEVEQRGSRRTILWCDAERDYLAKRIEVLGNRILSYDIDYERDEKTGQWFPTKWVWTSMRAIGNVDTQKTGEVLKYELDASVDAEEFEVEFPVGAYVRDRVNNQTHILLENDAVRIVTEAERRTPYDELMAPRIQSESGQGDEEPRE